MTPEEKRINLIKYVFGNSVNEIDLETLSMMLQAYAEWYFEHRRKWCPFCGNEITVYDLKEYKNDKP